MTLPVTHDEQSALDRLYPSMKQTPAPKPAASSIFSSFAAPSQPVQPVETEANRVVNQAREEGKFSQLSDEQLGEHVYGSKVPGAGDPLPDYGHLMGGFFDSKEIEARGINDTDELQTIAEAREAINRVFIEHSIGGSEARQLMAVAKDYDSNPRDPESHEALANSTYESLRQQYGSRTPQMIEGAKRVAGELCRKIPNLSTLMDMGLASDPVFVRSMIFAARRKGYI